MKSIDLLLEGNRSFSQSCDQAEMKKLSQGQSPKILWIGCSDSRVCPETISQLGLGNIFVHRNIANQVNTKDQNLLSVIEYAVNFLKVESIVVSGHSSCGGAKAAIAGLEGTTHIGGWIEDLCSLASEVKSEGASLSEEELETKVLNENVKRQVKHLEQIPIVSEGVKNGLNLYGCLFNIEHGKLELVCGGENG